MYVTETDMLLNHHSVYVTETDILLNHHNVYVTDTFYSTITV